MAISNDIITNRLNKKINYGVARTEVDSVIGPTGEAMDSPVFNPSSDLWINSDVIPASFLGTSVNTSDMLVYQYTSSASGAGTDNGETVGVLELKEASGTDVTYGSGDYATYIACTNRSSAAATRLKDWIPFGFFGATYLTNFAVATEGYHQTNTNMSGVTYYSQIFPDTSGYEFYFDTDAGVLVFAGTNGPPTSLTSGRSIYLIKGARYQGPKGIKAWPLDEDNMSSNSDTRPATQQSIKAYVDAGGGGGGGSLPGTADENDALTYRSGVWSKSSELDLAEANVTVANVSTLYITTAVGGGAVLDEDNMASDSNTKLATQQSIKAYVDAGGGGGGGSLPGSATENDALTYRSGVWSKSNELDLAEANVTVGNVSTLYVTSAFGGEAFQDDDAFGSASPTKTASSESIKAYIDTNAATTGKSIAMSIVFGS